MKNSATRDAISLMPSRGNRKSYWQVAAISIGIAAITWFVFAPTLRYDFISHDDPDYIIRRPQVTGGLTLHGIAWASTHTVSSNWHPLTMTSHMLDCQIYGLRAGGHHATNVLIHMFAAILLFLVLRQMTTGPSSRRDESVQLANRIDHIWPSAFVAALFAIHPLRVESVAWIAERKDVLSGLFFMLTLAAYLRYVRKSSLGSYLLVVFVFALGLLSKPMLVTVPFVLLLLDYWPLRRFAAEPNVKSLADVNRGLIPWKLIGEKAPLLLLAAIMCGIALIAQKGAMPPIGYLPLWVRIYNTLLSYCIYIWKMTWPVKLALLYPYPVGALSGWKGLLAIVLLTAVTYVSWIFRRKAPYLITGWLWYLGMLVPVIGLVQVGGQPRADHYTYLPQIGLTLAATWAMLDLSASWRYRREILATLAIPVILAFAWCAKIQTSYWKNSESIWRHTLAVTSDNLLAQEYFGSVLLKQGREDEAIFHLQEALRINPANARVHELLGIAFLRQQHVAEAIEHYEKALALASPSINALNNVAFFLATYSDAQLRNGPRAVQLAERADQLSGGKDPFILRTLAAAYAESGRFDKAVATAKRALDLATAQNDAGLVANLKMDLDLYQMNFPRRDFGR